MITFLVAMLIALAVLVSICTVVQASSFKYYKSTFDKLRDGSLVLDYVSGGLYFFCAPDKVGKYSSDVVVFTRFDNTFGDVKVGPYDYIFGDLLSWLSPYSLLWWFEYKDWFEKNKEKFDNSK
jgi:hypothetical protein